MKKGFTLMEVLAVVLILAVIFSFGVPAWRAVRFDMKNAQAHEAAQKLAEAMRAFYQDNRGQQITDICFSSSSTDILTHNNCEGSGATGIPGAAGANASVKNLFGCRYVRYEDFKNIPYTFCVAPNASNSGKNKMPSTTPTGHISPGYGTATYMVTACGESEKKAGKKYACDSDKLAGYIYVDGHMKVTDNYQ